MSHTKGPWNANYTKFDGEHVGFHITCKKFGSLYPICETSSNADLAFSSSEIESNAALIARAPEMITEIEQLKEQRDELLDALKEIIAAADSKGWEVLDAGLDYARAAISKATSK